MNKYLTIIGIEVHVELKTESKMFCGCSSQHFRVKPNTHTCPTCLGLPGALPVANKKAIEWCLLIGQTLGCRINEESKFDRKNYFYPDLAKGYQISQYDQPFARHGELKLKIKNEKLKIIRINRVHLEEDTAKLVHQFQIRNPKSETQNNNYSLIDFNRSGVPLVEIVTEPDINSSDEAVEYLKKIQQIIRYLELSDCDMEKGSMRCEVNISLLENSKFETRNRKQFQNPKFQIQNKLPNYKVEVKNINSFRFVRKAIEYEIKRQTEILEQGKTPEQETRGFSEAKGITFSQRSKEEAHDYRYFPEPDIPPIKTKNLELVTSNLVELAEEKINRFVKNYQLPESQARILCSQKKVAQYFEKAIGQISDIGLIGQIANIIINKKVAIDKIPYSQLAKYLLQQKDQKITDQDQLSQIIKKVLKENNQAVNDLKKGKKEALGFLIGQVMRETQGKAEAEVVRKILEDKLNG